MKTRIISAIIALIIIIPLLILGGTPFTIAVILLGIIGFKELLDLKDKDRKLPLVIKILSLASFVAIVLNNISSNINYSVDFRVFTGIIFVILIPIVFYHDKNKYNISDALFLLGSIFFLGIAFNYLIYIRSAGLNYIIFLLLITIITDTFALITGMLIGKHNLSPSISPKKTWEGFIGGSIMGTFVATMFYTSIFDYNISLIYLVLIILALTIVGQLGDLVFSSIKRYYGIKDFGKIMPGHGGILDRLDSILFVLLAFSFLLGIL